MVMVVLNIGEPTTSLNNTFLTYGSQLALVLPCSPSSRENWEASRAPASNMNNTNNFNFTPSGIDASGSYNTSDWLSVLGGLATGGITGAASGAGVNDAIARLQALGQSGMTDYTNLAKTATEGINFTPYTLTSSLGTTQQTAPGVISQQLTPQQQANVNAAQQQQASLYGAAVPDTSGISNQAFGSLVI
jgi:hypothetical protein